MSMLGLQIEKIAANAEDSEDLIMIVNYFTPILLDYRFGGLCVRSKTFLDLRIGGYKIVTPTTPHEVCTSKACYSICSGAETAGIDSLIEFGERVPTRLWESISISEEGNILDPVKSGKKTSRFTRSKARKIDQPLKRIKSVKKVPDSSVRPAYDDLLEELRISKHGPPLWYCPTVVIEMGYSETLKVLERDARLWGVGSEFVVEQLLILGFDPKNLTLTVMHLDFTIQNLMRILNEDDEAEGRMLKMEERGSLLRCVSSRIDMKTTEAEGLKFLAEKEEEGIERSDLQSLLETEFRTNNTYNVHIDYFDRVGAQTVLPSMAAILDALQMQKRAITTSISTLVRDPIRSDFEPPTILSVDTQSSDLSTATKAEMFELRVPKKFHYLRARL